jgi:DNA-binding transcriptional regulator YiaG
VDIYDRTEDDTVLTHACYLVPTMRQFNVGLYRESLSLSQVEFCKMYGLNLSTLRKWEGNMAKPSWSTQFVKMLDDWIQTTSVRKPV